MDKKNPQHFETIDSQELNKFLNNASWYHSINFPGGLHSKGVYDHRNVLNYYGFPEYLTGKTVLDVGCSDGFFSFEFEKRGADKILAVDTNKFDGSIAIDPSPSKKDVYEKKYAENYAKNNYFLSLAKKMGLERVHTFLLTKKMLNSSVEYQDCSIYNLKKLDRKFDFVFCGDLIEHLKNPVEATEQLKDICNDHCIVALSSVTKIPWWGFLLSIDPRFKGRLVTYWGDWGGSFFHFTAKSYKKLLLASGFKRVEIFSEFKLKNKRTGENNRHAVFHCWIQ